MNDMREDLQSTSESLQRDAQLVQDLEAEKTRLEPTDPRVDELSERVEELIDRMGAKSTAERQIAAELRDEESVEDGRAERR